MNDPRYMIDCPICDGTGIISSDPCPYPDDVECNCTDCHQSGHCGDSHRCDFCDGQGQVSENYLNMNLKHVEQ